MSVGVFDPELARIQLNAMLDEIARLRTWLIRLHNGGLDPAMRRRVVLILDGQPAIKLDRDDEALELHRKWLKDNDRYDE
jgi:hypothetical protein